MNSGNETPPVYDSPIYENHIFRNATDTEIHPGALMSTDNGHTAALQTLFHGAKRTKVFGGLIGSNLSDAAKANYEVRGEIIGAVCGEVLGVEPGRFGTEERGSCHQTRRVSAPESQRRES